MLEGFLDTIKNVGIFIVCAQAIVHFRPKASYEKYIKVLVSIIVLVMLIAPCFQLLGDAEEFVASMKQYENLLSGREQMVWEENSGRYQEIYQETYRETYQEKQPIEPVEIRPVEVMK